MNEELKRERAIRMRYKHAIAKDMNLDFIRNSLYDIAEVCTEISWFSDDRESLIVALDGDTEEANEIILAFSALSSECDEMLEDLRESWTEHFDLLFGTICDSGMLGWDSYEGDYFGLDFRYEEEEARKENQKRLERLTKSEIISAAQHCFRIAKQFIALQYRYDCVKAEVDILKDKNLSLFKLISDINEEYEAYAESPCCNTSYDKLLASIVQQDLWVQ